MSNRPIDEIDYWSEIKLDIIKEYATAYSKIMRAQKKIKKYAYIDGFAGTGIHLSKTSGQMVAGSPLNALWVDPPFMEYHFIDLDGGCAENLRQLTAGKSNVNVHEGDCNSILIKDVFPKYHFRDFRRAICLLDPYKINIDWEVVRTAGAMGSIEIFYNFMIMDANRNVFWRDPEKVKEPQRKRMDSVWGDRSWRDAVYRKTRDLFGEYEEKECNEAVVEAFRQRLKKVAGFAYVPEPIPMRNSTGAAIYYLFFASPNKTGNKIVQDIFKKYKDKGLRTNGS
jgi:three-Cys-motif partner protein